MLARRIHAAGVLAPYPLVRTSAALPCDQEKLKDICAKLFTAAAGGTLLLADVKETPVLAQQYLIDHLVAAVADGVSVK